MSDTTVTAGAPSTAQGSPGVLARGAALGVGMALAANLAVFLAGNAGAPTRVITGGAPEGTDLDVGPVVAATVALSLLGSLALWAIDRFGSRGGARARDGVGARAFRGWAVLAAAVAVVSIPPVLRLDIDTGSKATLAAMHLVVGAATIAGHAIVRSRRRQDTRVA